MLAEQSLEETKETKSAFQKLFKFVASIAAAGLLGVALVSLLAPWWWFADILIQFATQLLIALAIMLALCLVARQWRLSLAFLVGMVVTGWPLAGYLWPGGSEEATPDDLRLMSFNVLTINHEFDKTLELIESEDPDIVLLYEIDPWWEEELAVLTDEYPFHVFDTRGDNFGIVALSRVPGSKVESFTTNPIGLPSASIRFDDGDTPVHIVGTHPVPPLGSKKSSERNEQLLAVADMVDQSTDARIMAGDFNVTPSSPWFGETARRAGVDDAAKGFGLPRTWGAFPSYLGGIKIDHVLVGPQIKVVDHRVGPDVGSDHRAIIVDFRIEPVSTDN